MRIATFGIIGLASLLTACSGSNGNSSGLAGGGGTPSANNAIGDVTKEPNDNYQVVQGANTSNLPATNNTTLDNQPLWQAGQFFASAYESPNVLALGGLDRSVPFAGITGTTTAPPTGNATYSGRYFAARRGGGEEGNLTLDYDFSNQTIAGTSGNFAVDGTANGNQLTGTVTFDGDTGNFEGGFYGTNEVAAAFQGEEIGGVFYGTEN